MPIQLLNLELIIQLQVVFVLPQTKIRITVESPDPSSVNSIWSARYDRTLDDVGEVQDEIDRKVIIALIGKVEIVGLERAKR